MTNYTDSLNMVVPKHITSVYAYYPQDDDMLLFNEVCRLVSEISVETWIYLSLLAGSVMMAVSMMLYVYRWSVYGYYDTDEYDDPKVVIVRRFISDSIDVEIEQMIDEYATRNYTIMDNRSVSDVSYPPSVKWNPKIVKRNMEYFMSRYLYRLSKPTRDIYIMSRNLYRSDYENYYQIAQMAGWRVEIWDVTVEDDSRGYVDDAMRDRMRVMRNKEESIYQYDNRTTRNIRMVV
jgi:hypothetical protein